MGASSSALFTSEKVLTPAQNAALPPEMRLSFEMEGRKKIGEGIMTSVEIHMHLTLKYQELIEELKDREYR